jgi:hypothetical protein
LLHRLRLRFRCGREAIFASVTNESDGTDTALY